MDRAQSPARNKMNARRPSPGNAAMPAVSYEIAGWREQYEACRTGVAKQIGYAATRPLLDVEARRWLTPATLTACSPVRVLRERGFPVEARRRWALTQVDVRNAVILVQGTGSGWDVLTWARFRPKRIIATDLFAFDAWTEIARFCAVKWNTVCEFHQAPLEDHRFLSDGSIDICVSDAVFEHCRNLGAVLAETRRLLKAGGRVYASYGPLWFCGGGDHFSSRGGLETLYNHLMLSPADYRNYVAAHRQQPEGFQDGYRYIELDLFSKLTTAAYLNEYRHAGLRLDALILELSSPGLEFRRTFASRYLDLVDATSGQCTPDDLIMKTNLVKLTKER
jgi:SAM-dependent methyltransferase